MSIWLLLLTFMALDPAPRSTAGTGELETALDLRGRGIEDRAPVRSKEENEEEFLAYCDALVTVSQAPPAALARQGRRDLTFAHLFEQPAVYRGEVVHVEGALVRLRHFQAPEFTWSQGVRDLYEGWIFDAATYGANAMCVVFTELPPGLGVAEKTERHVAFDGYFFKRYRYKAGDGWRDAPLLVGRAPILLDSRPPPRRSLSAAMLWSFVGAIGGIAALIGGLAWWYRRGDRRFHARLAIGRAAWIPETGWAERDPRADGTRVMREGIPTSHVE